MRVLIATGGTGGHIYPALALADAMKEKDPKTEILFVGTANRMEATEIPKAGYRFEAIKAKGLNGSALAKVQAIVQLVHAYFACRKIVRQFRPDYAIGFGNYISAPVILAAHFAHVPTMLHEQNSYAGKANRFLAQYADKIVGCYPENLQQFPASKTRILGNPRASVAAQAQRDPQVVRQLGLDPTKPLIVVVMGSLGSESVNAVMVKALKSMAGKAYQVLYVTGRAAYQQVQSQGLECANIKVVEYIDGVRVMVNADLAVVRGGATTAAEITVLGLPAIIIPSPYVPNNHQVLNAKALQEAGAALMIEEKDLTEAEITAKIEGVIFDPICLEGMRAAAKRLGHPDANEQIYNWIQQG
ncbi:undecaprenyldiphospho-muramoylpentapeptide beta-N-acetylglucosaminyltransferase [Holdemania massiliensis]